MIRVRKKPAEMVLADLKAQVSGYEKAEVTQLVAEVTGSKSYFNLLTLIELVPAEQAASPRVGSDKHPRVHRVNTEEHTLYAVRITDLTVDEALTIYIQANSGMQMPRKDVPPMVTVPGELSQNPPGLRPLLVGETDRQLQPILPHRHTACRVWSQLNMDKDWLKAFGKPFMRRISELSTEFLGYDLTRISEHIGNVYLFGCNPVLRSWDCRLVDYDKELLFRFNERVGQNISGCKLVLEEARGDNNGFYIEYTLNAADTLFTLPYFPDRLHSRLFDPAGNWIDHSFSGWVNFAVDIAIQDRVVEHHVTTADGTEVFSVSKKLYESRVQTTTYNWTAAHYLRDALAGRRFEELARSKEFVFFAKKPESETRAKAIVLELLNKARQRCMILDPYFGAADMLYIFQMQNVSLPVRVISSAAYLTGRPDPELPPPLRGWLGRWQRLKAAWHGRPFVNTLPTYMESLQQQLQDYAKAVPQQKVVCRVLRGRKSPLHDRFLVIDDEVYLLGSSLNEFGSRTTTISRMPVPGELIDQAEAWWKDEKVCPLIEKLLAERSERDVEA